MALLLDIRSPEWMTEEGLKDILRPHLPDVPIYCGTDDEIREDVIMLAAVKLNPGVAATLPNLKLVQKLGAGVETMVSNPDLASHIRITRLKPDGPAQEIAEFCLAYVLRGQRNMLFHEDQQSKTLWMPVAPRQSPYTTVGVLGLGHIGSRTARAFAALDFRVLGWSRSAKTIDGVHCYHGDEALPELLGQCDYVASVLPSTEQTRDLFDQKLIAKMKKGAVLINVGRGDLIIEEDLLDAVNTGHLGGAILDVFRQEPLPEDHPFWSHEKITVTPHVSGWHLDGGLEDVAENYRRLINELPLINEVDRQSGY